MEVLYKDIIGYPGYKIGSDGTILSSKRSKGYIKSFPNPEGYMFVYLYKDNKRHVEALHRLVALHFLDNPNNYGCVNHLDENPANNNVENLEWCTHSYNRKYGTCESRREITLSEKYSIAQYTLDDVLVAIFPTARAAARALGKNNSGFISNCVRNIKNTAYGYKWKKI